MNEEKESSEEELRERLDCFRSLVKNPGWKLLKEVLQEQIKVRQQTLLAFDPKTADDLFEIAKLGAERRALLLAIDLPKTILESVKEEIEDVDTETEV